MRMGALLRDGTTIKETTCTAVRRGAEGPVRSAVLSSAVRWFESRRVEQRHYSWIEDHLARLEGKEARGEYYAHLG